MNYVVAIAGISLLIALHEFGHLVVARLTGMRVERYSIGFGPVLLKVKPRETEYCLSAIPIGGYVKIAGMLPGEEGEGEEDPRAFNHRPAWQRLLVVAAGPLTNELLAAALVYVMAVVGLPNMKVAGVGRVEPGSAAAEAGLQAGDLILRVDGNPLATFQDLVSAIHAHAGENIALDVSRSGQELRLWAKLGAPPVLGVEPLARRYGPLDAVPAAFSWTGRQTVGIVTGLADAIRNHGAQLEGPIGTVQVTAQQSEHGWKNLVFTLALISLALAVFNVLPWPALDGGRLIFLLWELVARRPVNQRVETAVHAMGFLLLLGLIAVVTAGDLHRLGHRAAPEPAPAATPATDGG